MEVGRADVQRAPGGQRVIDLSLRPRHRQDDGFAAPVASTAVEEPLVVPRFDDEESDSSSDEEGDGPHRYGNPRATVQVSRIPTIKATAKRSTRRDNNEDDDGDNDRRGSNPAMSGVTSFAGGEMQWAGVQQIQQLTNANAALSDQVDALKRQLKAMEIQVEALAPVPGFNAEAVQDILLDKDAAENDVRDAKIVHQARMIRQLKRATQRDKQVAADATKLSKAAEEACAKLEKEVETLRLKVQRLEARAAATAASLSTNSDDPPLPVAVASSSSALTEAKKQCEELKVKNAGLQAELKRTQRALVREAGEEVPLEELVNGGGTSGDGRRGRAQQIIMLKAKVKKLQTDLSAVTISAAAPVDGATAAAPTETLDVDERAHKELANQAVHRQRQVDKLTAERDALQESTQQLSRKLEALKSRVQVLDKEKQDAKAKLQVLVDKSRTDDALVDALQRQVEVWKGKFQDAKRELKGSGERAETPTGDSQRPMPAPSEASQFRALVVEKERLTELAKNLGAQLEEKDKQLRASAGLQSQQPLMNAQPPQQSSVTLLPGLVGPSRIPRKPMRPGPLSRGEDALTPPLSSGSSRSRVDELEAEMETLRRTFRDSLREKDEQIAALDRKQRSLAEEAASRSSRGASGREVDPSTSLSDRDNDAQALAQEVEDLQEENQFLRDEFDKLKARYEALTRASQTSGRR